MTDIPTITQQEAVEVIQEDREAAAALVRWQREATKAWENADGEAWQFFVPGFSRAIIQGIWDEHPVVQSLARHRIAALSPNMDHAVGGVREADERSAFKAWAADMWQNSYAPDAAWIGWRGRAALTTPPVNQDAVREALKMLRDASLATVKAILEHDGRAALIAGNEINNMIPSINKLLAPPPLDNTGLDAATGWQPIETAPKDRLILVAAEFDRPGDWRIKVGGWHDLGYWQVFGASWVPTQWQPLPAPPALASGDRS